MRLFLVPLALFAIILTACSASESSDSGPVLPTATPLPENLTSRARTSLLPRLDQELRDLLEGQSWIEEVSKAEYALITSIRDCETAAKRRGEEDSVAAMLQFASEQRWYQDGLDDNEAKALAGVFTAYDVSLSKRYAPPVGSMIANTLRQGSFAVVPLLEEGELALLVASENETLAQEALRLAMDAVPKIEELTGPFPYEFLYIEVTPYLSEVYAGLSYDQFIALSPEYVDAATVIHEITHSTLYGIFPTWFEEGFAHFSEIYYTNDLEGGLAYYTATIQQVGRDDALDLRLHSSYSWEDYVAERAQGLIFIHGLYEIEGIDGLSRMVGALRTKTYSDQELLRAIIEQASPEHKQRLEELVCGGVLGVRSGC